MVAYERRQLLQHGLASLCASVGSSMKVLRAEMPFLRTSGLELSRGASTLSRGISVGRKAAGEAEEDGRALAEGEDTMDGGPPVELPNTTVISVVKTENVPAMRAASTAAAIAPTSATC